MESDSDEGLDRSTDFGSDDPAIPEHQSGPSHSKFNNDSLSQFGLLPEYTASWVQSGSSVSPTDDEDRVDHKSIPDEIVIKHIRVPLDWDPVRPPTNHNHSLESIPFSIKIILFSSCSCRKSC